MGRSAVRRIASAARVPVELLRDERELEGRNDPRVSTVLGFAVLDQDADAYPELKLAPVAWTGAEPVLDPDQREYLEAIQGMPSGLFAEHAAYNVKQRAAVAGLVAPLEAIAREQRTEHEARELAILTAWRDRVEAYVAHDEREAARRAGVRAAGRDPDNEAPTRRRGELPPSAGTSHKVKDRSEDLAMRIESQRERARLEALKRAAQGGRS